MYLWRDVVKIVIPLVKPRAKRLNDLLRSKRGAKHSDVRFPSRARQKQKLEQEVYFG